MSDGLRIERGWIHVDGSRRDDGTIELGTGGELPDARLSVDPGQACPSAVRETPSPSGSTRSHRTRVSVVALPPIVQLPTRGEVSDV
jgi:hypothetical protein